MGADPLGGVAMSGEEMRALSEYRDLAFRQSAMTAFGTVPSLSQVRQALSDCLMRSFPFSPAARPATPSKGRAVSNLKVMK